MLGSIRCAICGAFVAMASQAFAGNLNDLWYDPAEPGWGVNVIEQNDVLFLTLFVYDAQGRPVWLVGSETRRSGLGSTYFGPLYLTSGPPFSTTFDPHAVTASEVGYVEFALNADGTATLTNSFPELHTKTVQRQTWQTIHINPMVTGGMTDPRMYAVPYIGTFQLAAFNTGCPVNADPDTAWQQAETRFTLTMKPEAGAGGSFELRTERYQAAGKYVQAGSIIRVTMTSTVKPDPASILPAGEYRVSIDPLVVDEAFVHGRVTFLGIGFPCLVQFAMAGHIPGVAQMLFW